MISADKNRRLVGRILPHPCFLLIALLFLGCQKPEQKVESLTFSGSTMGTTFTIKVSGSREKRFSEQVQHDIIKLLESLNSSMSNYQSDSEISTFNGSRSTDWFRISEPLLMVLRESIRISEMTSGAFDITVGGLVNLWGFGPKLPTKPKPSHEAVRQFIKSVNFRKIKIKDNPPAVKKENPVVTMDLSAIAKGFAVDRVADLLEKSGIENFMVEIGGEIRTKGTKLEGVPWIIAIEKPDFKQRAVHKIIALGNNGMATSGDYRNYFEKEGKRYSHLLDPNTGQPITHQLASVSVIHPLCMTADALATALMVMGPEKGFRLAMDRDIAAFFIIRTDAGFEEKTTPAFKMFFRKAKR